MISSSCFIPGIQIHEMIFVEFIPILSILVFGSKFIILFTDKGREAQKERLSTLPESHS